MKVRDKLPIRRLVPTKSPKEGGWTKHKADLREDFHLHCGYCGSYDGYRHTWYEVDHFIPKSLLDNEISNIEYTNLVYSCKFCNNNKLSKWPTKDITIPNSNNKGFVDPCDEEFDIHLYRTNDGGIMWNTDLGEWMWKEAFKFDERNYSLKLLWELNQRRKLIDVFIIELNKREEGSNEYNEIKAEAEKLSFEYYKYNKALIEHYNSI
ncbi:MAG: HNH endonuclease [uncultured Aureispira sp.]|uniref:HNH endonuclease n=1 Tax=uncultured Aureispira sp. TaxID=1331704 RepID=A0A6S6S1J4_9BACT|nr:MAG: HNH endonuclease [uncultured Aureispira sp.]